MTSNATVPASTIWAKADQLLRSDQLNTAAAESLIESTFSFEVYHPGFAGRVAAVREFFWNDAAPPFGADEEGEAKRKLWIQNLNWRIKGMAPEQGEEQADRFDGELRRISADFAVSRWAVERYLFFGILPDAPPLRAVLRQSDSGPYAIELRVLSSSVTGDQLKYFYENLKANSPIPSLSNDRVASNDAGRPRAEELVRSWAVLCLQDRANMGQEEAVEAWNQRFPHLAVRPQELNAAQIDTLRQRAAGLVWGS